MVFIVFFPFDFTQWKRHFEYSVIFKAFNNNDNNNGSPNLRQTNGPNNNQQQQKKNLQNGRLCCPG